MCFCFLVQTMMYHLNLSYDKNPSEQTFSNNNKQTRKKEKEK